MGNVSTIEITEELEVKCIASAIIGNGSVDKTTDEGCCGLHTQG